MKLGMIAFFAGLLFLSFNANAQDGGLLAEESGIISKASTYSVRETMDRLEAAAKNDGLTIFARIDFLEISKQAGVDIRPNQLLILGRGRSTPAMLAEAPLSAIDLPFKALVWEDSKGKVWLSYTNGSYLLKKYAIKSAAPNAKNVDATFERISSAALQ
jgi:uncharacterized protein (DUF302 family)